MEPVLAPSDITGCTERQPEQKSYKRISLKVLHVLKLTNYDQACWFIILLSGLLEGLFNGVTTSNCPLPCTTISTETRHTQDFSDGFLGFAVSFQNTVEVKSLKLLNIDFVPR